MMAVVDKLSFKIQLEYVVYNINKCILRYTQPDIPIRTHRYQLQLYKTIYAHVHTHMRVCMHARIHTCIHTYIRTHAKTRTALQSGSISKRRQHTHFFHTSCSTCNFTPMQYLINFWRHTQYALCLVSNWMRIHK